MSISQSRLEQLRRMIAAGTQDAFYDWPEWEKLRSQVLALDSFECQECKKLRRYRKARIVHHVKHLRDRPDLALSVLVPTLNGQRKRRWKISFQASFWVLLFVASSTQTD